MVKSVTGRMNIYTKKKKIKTRTVSLVLGVQCACIYESGTI